MKHSLTDVLTRVWRDQGRIDFVLSDPERDPVETRYAEDPISGVRFRSRRPPHRELRSNIPELEARGILDPARHESALLRDPRNPSGRFCFLCPGNIRECNPKEELVPVSPDGRSYHAGAIFAWISREHFTVMAADHIDQRFSVHTLRAMLELHAPTDGRSACSTTAPPPAPRSRGTSTIK